MEKAEAQFNAATEPTRVQKLQGEVQKLTQAIGIMNAGDDLENDELEDAAVEAFAEQLDKIRTVFEEEFEHGSN